MADDSHNDVETVHRHDSQSADTARSRTPVFVTPTTAIDPGRRDDTIKLDRAIVLRDPSFPAQFGRYRVQARIGVGGFATVYSAIDPHLDAPVAIKVLAENHSADIEIRRRFVAEARVARRLGSERLIGVFDVGETDDGRPYVVMELAERGTLRARMARLVPASLPALLHLIEELAACLEAIHAKGVVHRDIKPTNLLLRSVSGEPFSEVDDLIRPDERLVLADFGLARDISSGASALTVGGGTAGYMAPEQADPSGKADFRADIYAASVVVAEVATGRHPERLDLATAPLSAAARAALEDGLALDRHRRPDSARAWRDRLIEAFSGDGPTSLIDADSPTLVSPIVDTPSAAEPTARPPVTRIRAPYPYGQDGFEDTGDSFDVAPDRNNGDHEDHGDRDRPRSDAGPTPPPPPPSLPQDLSLRPPPLAGSSATAAPAPPLAPPIPLRPGPPGGILPPVRIQPPPSTHPPISVQPPVRIQPPPSTPPARSLPPPPTAAAVPLTVAPVPVAAGPVRVTPAPPLVARPSGPAPAWPEPGDPTESEARSRRHLKTAQKLAKLEHKANRRQARRRRRRRRLLAVVNFFLALIRGFLSAGLALVATTLFLANQAGVTPAELGPRDGQVAFGVALTAFFLGILLFPWPRSIRD